MSENAQDDYLVAAGLARATTWDDLLKSKRVLIVSEAGAGKTYECQAQKQRLWDDGEAAFLLELSTLATEDVHSMLTTEERKRLDVWLSSQAGNATFFLDSIDELKLSHGSFGQALKRLEQCIGGQLGRAHIIITTRPIPYDEELVRRLLPVPAPPESKADGDTFAHVAIHGKETKKPSDDDNQPPEWRNVALMPLSEGQILEFSRQCSHEMVAQRNMHLIWTAARKDAEFLA